LGELSIGQKSTLGKPAVRQTSLGELALGKKEGWANFFWQTCNWAKDHSIIFLQPG